MALTLGVGPGRVDVIIVAGKTLGFVVRGRLDRERLEAEIAGSLRGGARSRAAIAEEWDELEQGPERRHRASHDSDPQFDGTPDGDLGHTLEVVVRASVVEQERQAHDGERTRTGLG